MSVIKVVKLSLDDPRYEGTADFNVPEDLPSILTTGTLSTALTNLIEAFEGGQLEPHTVLNIEISHAGSILFRIRRRYSEHAFHPNPESLVAWPGSPIAIAALIIHQHGSELKIMPDDDGVTFEFELPVWHEDET